MCHACAGAFGPAAAPFTNNVSDDAPACACQCGRALDPLPLEPLVVRPTIYVVGCLECGECGRVLVLAIITLTIALGHTVRGAVHLRVTADSAVTVCESVRLLVCVNSSL